MTTSLTPIAEQVLRRIGAASEKLFATAQVFERSSAWQGLQATIAALTNTLKQGQTPPFSDVSSLDPQALTSKLVTFVQQFCLPDYLVASNATSEVFSPHLDAEMAKADGLSALAELLDAVAIKLTVCLVGKDTAELHWSVGKDSSACVSAVFRGAKMTAEIDLGATRAALSHLVKLGLSLGPSPRVLSRSLLGLTELQGRLKLFVNTCDREAISFSCHVLTPLEVVAKPDFGDVHIVAMPTEPLVSISSTVKTGELAMTLATGEITATLPGACFDKARRDISQINLGACGLTMSMQNDDKQLRLHDITMPAQLFSVTRDHAPHLTVGVTPAQPSQPLAVSLLPTATTDVRAKFEKGTTVRVVTPNGAYEVKVAPATTLRLISATPGSSPTILIQDGSLFLVGPKASTPRLFSAGQTLTLRPSPLVTIWGPSREA